MKELIKSFEDRLESYKKSLSENPKSTFYEGLIKNTEEYIRELKKTQDALNRRNIDKKK